MTRQVESWNETPAANDFDIDEGGAPPSHKRTKVDDSNRERMSAIASLYQDGLEWLDLLRDPTDRSISFPVAKASDTEIAITSGTNDLSSLFNTGRRIKTTDGGVDTDEVEVLSVSYSNPTTTVTIFAADGDTVTDDIDGMLIHSSASLKRFAFRDTIPTQYILLNGLTDADFATALAEVVTAGGGTILLPVGTVALTGQHTIPINCRIIGQGIDISTLDSSSTENSAILYVPIGFKVGFESFTLLGGPGGGAGTEHGILFKTGSAVHARIKDVEFSLIEGDAIRFEDCLVLRDNVISGCMIGSCGGNGIYADDNNSDAARNSISDLSIWTFGSDLAGVSYGIRVAGQWELSNISISGLDLAGPAQQVGLAFWEKVAANPNEQDAHHCSVSGISVTGTGAEARGIDMNGRFCSVTGANIKLTGASSTGVRVGGTLGSQLAQNNKLSASSITAAIGYDEENTAAKNNLVVGCSFQDCGVDVRLQASGGGLIADNVMSDATSAGEASILVASGDNYLIRGNRIRGCAGDGIDVQSGSTGCRVTQNEVISAAGSDYVNGAGADGVFIDNHPCANETFVHKTSSQLVTTGTAEVIADLDALDYPAGDGGPDGFKTYAVDVHIPYQVNEIGGGDRFDAQIELRSGPLGTASDPLFTLYQITTFLEDYEADMSIGGYQITPDAGDKVTLVVDLNSLTNSEFTIYGSGNLASSARKATLRIRRVRND